MGMPLVQFKTYHTRKSIHVFVRYKILFSVLFFLVKQFVLLMSRMNHALDVF